MLGNEVCAGAALEAGAESPQNDRDRVLRRHVVFLRELLFVAVPERPTAWRLPAEPERHAILIIQ